jgi:hypothetical protein
MIRVVAGPNELFFTAKNNTVGQFAVGLREVLNISHDAEAWVNGRLVDYSYVLHDGDNLEFVTTKGRKGGCHSERNSKGWRSGATYGAIIIPYHSENSAMKDRLRQWKTLDEVLQRQFRLDKLRRESGW